MEGQEAKAKATVETMRRQAEGVAAQSAVPDELQRVQAELEASRVHCAALFDLAPVAYCTLDEHGRIVRANLAFLRLLGAERDDVVNRPWTEFVREDDRADERRFRRKRVTPGGAKSCELRVLRLDGTEFWGAITASVSPGTHPPSAFFFTLTDISTQRHSLQITGEPEMLLRLALSGGSLGLWDWNAATGELWVDERWRTMLGLSPHGPAVTIEDWHARVHPDDQPQLDRLVEDVILNPTGSLFESEIRVRHEDGRWIWVLDKGAVVERDAEHRPRRVIGTHMDITERKTSERALRDSEERYRTLVQWLPQPFVLHRDGQLIFANPTAVSMLGAQSEEQLLGRPVLDIVHRDFHDMVRQRIKQVVSIGVSVPPAEMRFIKLDGTLMDVEVRSTPLAFDGAPAVLVAWHDITERKVAEDKLRLAASVFTSSPEGIMITNAEGSIVDVNDAFTRITGYSRDEVLGQSASLLKSDRHGPEFCADLVRSLAEKSRWSGEVRDRRKNGEPYTQMLTVVAVPDAKGEVRQHVAMFTDITPLKEYQKRLEHIAHYDALTGLPNRVLLADRLHQATTQSLRSRRMLGVVFIDVDGFKDINDRHGHAAGDKFLIALADRMKHALREGDTLARLGGDEFVSVLVDLVDAAASVPTLTRLLAAASEPVIFGGLRLQASASIGITFYPQAQEIDAEQLLRQADQAMYQAKLAGKNRYHVFDAELDRSVRGHHETLDRIRQALAHHEFVLHYQPKVNMQSGELTGAEALIRWQHPERGLLLPADFLPVIEGHSIAVDIGEWVLNTALGQMEGWKARGLTIPVSVNVAARQMQQPGFVDRLSAMLQAHPTVQPGELDLEVLETSALQDVGRTAEIIDACRDIGVMFALDDFGTGYSSLTYLRRLPVTLLKIDRSFVLGMLDDPNDLAILEGVIGLANAFHCRVIAEGVETVPQGEALLKLGCELAQGFGIARPMPGDELPAWSAGWQPDPAWSNGGLALGRISAESLPSVRATPQRR